MLLLLSTNKEDVDQNMTIVIRATQGNLAEADSDEFDFTCADPCLET